MGRSEAFTNQNAAKTFYWNTFKKNIYIYMWSQSANVQKLWIHDLLDALKNNNK